MLCLLPTKRETQTPSLCIIIMSSTVHQATCLAKIFLSLVIKANKYVDFPYLIVNLVAPVPVGLFPVPLTIGALPVPVG